MKQSFILLLHRFSSFFLRSAIVYVEPLLQPWQKPESKKLYDPIAATDLLKYWPGLSEHDLALLIEHALASHDADSAFARPYIRISETRAVCTDTAKFEESGYTPKTTFPHITFLNGRKRFDFSRLLFDRKELSPYEQHFKTLDEILASPTAPSDTVSPFLKAHAERIATEIAEIKASLRKKDSQLLLKYLPEVQKIFEHEFCKSPPQHMEYKRDDRECAPVKIKKSEFIKKLEEGIPGLPKSIYGEFWKLLAPLYKLSGREGEPE